MTTEKTDAVVQETDAIARDDFERLTAETIERLPVPFFVLVPSSGADHRFEVIWANDTGREFAGRPESGWSPVDQLLGDIPGLEREAARAHDEGRVITLLRPVDRDDLIDHLRLVLLPLEHGVALFAEDASRDASIRAELDVAERTLERVQRWGQLGVWEVDLTTGEHYWSTQVFEILGVDEATFERFRDVVHPGDVDLVDHVLLRALEQPGPYKLTHRIARDGEERMLSQHMQSVPGPSGRPERLMGAMIDVTATEALEQQLHRSQRMRSIGLLAGGLAHDFNNALAILMGHLEVVSRHDAVASESGLVASIDAMKRATTRASNLTRKLMSLGQHHDTAVETCPVTEVLHGAARLVSPALGTDVTVTVEADDLAGLEVAADPDHVEQVLLDLMLNARDAGAYCVTLRGERVEVGAGDDLHVGWDLEPGSYGVVSVIDDGSGMDREVLQSIFEPFFTTKDREHGSGLGLTNADRFARRAGGALVANSAPGTGTTMALHLPVVDSAVTSDPAPRERRRRGRPTRVVVAVGDDRRSDTLAAALADRRRQVVSADSTTAMSRILTSEPIDLVVIDAALLDPVAQRILDPGRTIVLGDRGSGALVDAAHLDDPDDVEGCERLVTEMLS